MLQKTKPQWRQWWRRSKREKAFWQIGASQIRASASGFQCSRVGSPATSGRSFSISSIETAFCLLSAVDRRLTGRPASKPTRLSVLS